MKRWHSLPAEVYALVDETPATVLLEGGKPNASEEPWTRLFTAPLRVCTANTLEELPALFAAIEDAVHAGLWAAGFFCYECGEFFEPRSRMRTGPSRGALAWFGIYERSHFFDPETGQFARGEPPGLAELCERLPKDAGGADVTAQFAVGQDEFTRRIAAIHEWIRAGDVYQLNFTAPWRVMTSGSAAALFQRLRAQQPAEYGAFLHGNEAQKILSFSPELFFRIEHESSERCIITRPMKGTTRRGRYAREDLECAEWLRNDAKNRSENVMIVDLLRNDLGRIAKFGSVRAEKLFEVERYPTLWQMTSTVRAELREEANFEQIFRALFPCGSITGAPKVRAMQLIAELEEEPRGVYTGAIGFFSPKQTIFNVAIRTLELKGTVGVMGTGSGIVIDSHATEEYRECLLKAEFLTKAPPAFCLVETMLWDGEFPLLDLHLERLAGSAGYFDFACEPEAIRAALAAYAQRFADGGARKVRLLLDREGTWTVTDEVLAMSDPERIGRVSIAQARTDPADVLLFHKTTHRPHYAEALQHAVLNGFDDVLFFNLRGELTEGSISNVFVEKDGRWFTPPVECGLLAGVYRRHVLEMRADIEERVLVEGDLLSADAVYLSNAVRGLRRVQIESGDA